MINYVFNSSTRKYYKEIAKTISSLINTPNLVIICVGSDLVVGDSLGPYVGTLLNEKLKGKAYVYGTLDSPITAKEIPCVYKNVKLLHPNSKILVIDAAVGKEEDVGVIKIKNSGIQPGLACNKNLPLIGDVSIIAIVSYSQKTLYTTRFSLVYKLSCDIVEGVCTALTY